MSREQKSSKSDKSSQSTKKTGTGSKSGTFKKKSEFTSRSEKPFASKSTKDNKSSGNRKSADFKSDKAKETSSREDKPAMFINRAEKSTKKFSRTTKKDDDDSKLTEKKVKSNYNPRSEFKTKKSKGDPLPTFSDNVRLNKYISNAGICSRREADLMITSGIVQVNGKIVTELGYKVKPGDEIKYDGATIRSEKKQYVLLNKPKDFITTMDDPMNRKTVMQLVVKACKERIYPVGRLDRNTTGLLLFTNDGDLAKKLTHPRYEIKKLYHVETADAVSVAQIQALLSGVELDDGGFVKADKVELIKDSKNREVGIEIHSGKYRVVRRMFESLGHVVKKLDRVSFAGLTKKDLPRGTYRHLTEQEVSFLRML